jgi:hypothetical protein
MREDVLSIWIQDNKKCATRLLTALISTCSVSTSISTTLTDSRPISLEPRMGQTKTCFVWQDFNKKFNPKCIAPVLPSKQLEQNRCSELVPVMGKAVKK